MRRECLYNNLRQNILSRIECRTWVALEFNSLINCTRRNGPRQDHLRRKAGLRFIQVAPSTASICFVPDLDQCANDRKLAASVQDRVNLLDQIVAPRLDGFYLIRDKIVQSWRSSVPPSRPSMPPRRATMSGGMVSGADLSPLDGGSFSGRRNAGVDHTQMIDLAHTGQASANFPQI